jgi:CheY-like chemotaxis protein/DNA-directed RNA polymerase specialized sigma24 family protein
MIRNAEHRRNIMSTSDSVAPYVPFLRRFARALSGTQAGGDAYVAATLEAILADPDCLDPQLDPKVALYKLFVRGWRDVPANNYVDVPIYGDEASAKRNLAAISLEPRIAFLLSAVESFSPKEIAQTLDCSQAEAADLVDRAGREISEQIRTTVLIIEDEPLIALDIQTLVEQLGHDVTTIARTHADAVRAALKRRPGLILADIQLADGSSGLDAVNEILGLQEVPVIFITAFPERFLTGQAPEPAFLITKPFSADSVKAVVSQALFFDRKSQRTLAKAAAGGNAD